MEHLWLFLQEAGVDSTNNHAERMLRLGVLWRKRSLGTASVHDDRWGERVLTLRLTCKIQRRRTFPVLVDAVSIAIFEPRLDSEFGYPVSAYRAFMNSYRIELSTASLFFRSFRVFRG